MKSIPTAKEIHYDLGSSVLSCNTADSLERCLCMYCEKVTAGPILFKCEHMSCRSCFIRHNFKKPISETKCIKCGYLIISSTDVAASGIIQTCIDNLKATCNTGEFFIRTSEGIPTDTRFPKFYLITQISRLGWLFISSLFPIPLPWKTCIKSCLFTLYFLIHGILDIVLIKRKYFTFWSFRFLWRIHSAKWSSST